MLTGLRNVEKLNGGNLRLSLFFELLINVILALIVLVISILLRSVAILQYWCLPLRLNDKLLTVAYNGSPNTCCCCGINLDERVAHHLLRFILNVGELLLCELLLHSMSSA